MVKLLYLLKEGVGIRLTATGAQGELIEIDAIKLVRRVGDEDRMAAIRSATGLQAEGGEGSS